VIPGSRVCRCKVERKLYDIPERLGGSLLSLIASVLKYIDLLLLYYQVRTNNEDDDVGLLCKYEMTKKQMLNVI